MTNDELQKDTQFGDELGLAARSNTNYSRENAAQEVESLLLLEEDETDMF